MSDFQPRPLGHYSQRQDQKNWSQMKAMVISLVVIVVVAAVLAKVAGIL